MQRRCDGLNERVARLKDERDQAIARAKKAKARERSGGSRTMIKAPLVQGDVVSLLSHIREPESDVSRIQGNVQRGNANLRECQHKLYAALIREKILEGEIRAKDLLIKRKDELLKDLPARVELKTELGMLRARVRHERLKARFAKAVVPDVARSDLLKVIVAYSVEEVKRLESERDTVLKTLSDKGCTCRAEIDRGDDESPYLHLNGLVLEFDGEAFPTALRRAEARLQNNAAYVTQDDILMKTLTVKEAVYYSAMLQLPDSMSKAKKKGRVEATIREMGLQDAMNTRIGGRGIQGISGGQKRRVRICIEILTRPKLLFLDKPSSGLDSAA
ncbi:hypothetical protein GIB67_011933 [Kingdonia uniflora]|uniref:ABC transporter domain-containing protein n=1 Tax=Kingdonia uniflora TaxID=39325 RepID=A0A7J7M048_9MAGN|nr:hypothetical protein GIB67_011933 [Kingdonia uniflora]